MSAHAERPAEGAAPAEGVGERPAGAEPAGGDGPRRAEEEAPLLCQIALGIGEAPDLDGALAFVLEHVCAATGWAVGEAWVPSDDRSRIVCHRVWRARLPGLEAFERASREAAFAPGEGLPGSVWASRAPVWIADLRSAPSFPRRDAALGAGLRAALGVPVLSGGEVVLVLDFIFSEARPLDPRLVHVVSAAAAQIGLILERKKAADALAREQALSASLLKSLPGIFYLFDDSGRFVRWNDNFERASGYTGAEVARLHPLDLFEGEEKTLIEERIRAALERGSADAEAHFVAKDGARRTPFYFTGVRVMLEGRPHLVGVGVDLTERDRARRLLDAALAQSPAGIVIASAPDATIRLVNLAALRIRGDRDGEPLAGSALTEYVARWRPRRPDGTPYRHDETPLARATLRGETSHDEEMIIRDEAGADRWVSANAAPVLGPHGEVTAGIVVFHDVTSRRQAEATMRLQALALNSAANAIMITDREGRIEWVNPAWTAMTGFRADEAHGKTPRILKSGMQDARFYQEFWREALAGKVVVGELVNRRKDGTLYHEHETITPLTDARGRVTHFIAVKVDITERKRAEEARQAREAQFRALVENTSDLITLVSGDGTIRFQGPSSERLLGEPPGAMTGRPIEDWIHPADAPRFAEALARALAAPAAPLSVELRARRRDGAWRTFESLVRGVADGSGGRIALVNSRDVTEHRRLEEQLRQAQKLEAVGQIAGGVAHDFNNIITIVMMEAALLKAAAHDPERVRSGLEQILLAAARAAGLTRQLLLFSRKQVMQMRDLDLNEVVSSLAKMLRRLIGEDVQLLLALHPSPLPARGDAGMLDQVLLNLAVNARDAMPGGGRLTIETGAREVDGASPRLHPDAAPGRYVRMSVRDTGAGIAPEVLPRIFEPFFTTKEPGKGTGLGLATVFGIVKQHCGWVEVESESGRGATFHVFIPAREPAPAPAQVAPDEDVSAPRGGMETILLVEDEPHVRQLTRRALERQGYRVLEASHGPEALALWERGAAAIDLLLTDMVMPEGMSGRDLAARIRARDPRLRILFTSGYSPDVAGRGLRLGPGESFLQKPATIHDLLEAVRRSLDG